MTSLLPFTGCHTGVEEHADGSRSTYYFGVTRVDWPATTETGKGFEVLQVANWGVGAGAVNGFTLGYAKAELASVPQTERGSVYIRVENEQQMKSVQNMLQALANGQHDFFVSQATATQALKGATDPAPAGSGNLSTPKN